MISSDPSPSRSSVATDQTISLVGYCHDRETRRGTSGAGVLVAVGEAPGVGAKTGAIMGDAVAVVAGVVARADGGDVKDSGPAQPARVKRTRIMQSLQREFTMPHACQRISYRAGPLSPWRGQARVACHALDVYRRRSQVPCGISTRLHWSQRRRRRCANHHGSWTTLPGSSWPPHCCAQYSISQKMCKLVVGRPRPVMPRHARRTPLRASCPSAPHCEACRPRASSARLFPTTGSGHCRGLRALV